MNRQATPHPRSSARAYRRLLLLTALLIFALSTPFQAASVKFSAKLSRTKYLVGEQGQIKFQNTARITYKFKSSNRHVFKVTKAGVVKAKGAGSAVLTVTGTWKKGEKTKTWQKKVTLWVYNCSLSKTSLSLQQSKSKTLKVRGNELKRKVKWESETPLICSVSAGKVKALTEGVGYVHAKVGSQLVLRCKVTVTATALKSFSARLLVNSRHIYGALNLANEFYKQACNGKKITYSVAKPNLGTMDGDVYRALAHGSNTVTAYCGAYKMKFSFTQSAWCAHRGYCDMYPENTIDAFVGAALAGAGYIETDLRVTKDGALVLMHDSALANMTNAEKTATVSTLTLEEIRALEINNGNCLSSLQNKQVPTLEEYLQVCQQYGIIPIIELKSLGKKSQQENSVQQIVALLSKYGLLRRSMVISFSTERLRLFREYGGEAWDIVPIAPCDVSDYQTLVSLSLPNLYRHHSQTPLGYEFMQDFSPLSSRKHKVPATYHNRV